MSEPANSANQASAIVVESPHTDEVTVAWSKVDVCAARLAELDPEHVRLLDKLARAQADVEAAQGYVAANEAAVAERSAELDAARAELEAAEAANPELAEAVAARRDQSLNQRRKELADELARLGG
jgi:chromosome segregation ATPase